MFDPHAEVQLVRPAITAEDALHVASASYALNGTVKELGSNQDRNYLLTPVSGPRYLLKFDNDAFSTAEIEVQNEALLHLSSRSISVPTPLRDVRGEWISTATVGGRPVRARLLSFVEGTSLVNDGHLFPSIITRLGFLAGRVVSELASLPSTDSGRWGALDRDLQWDMRNAIQVIEAYAPEIADPARRQAVLSTSRSAWPIVQSHAPKLPIQAIHGDITDDNVVGPRDSLGRIVPASVIDWGDLSTGWRVAEIAVTVSSIMHHNRGAPLDALPAIVAFDEIVPLTEEEIAVLWPLVVLRGAVIVASGAHQAALEPENAYVAERMAHEWHIFDTAAQVSFQLAEAAIRAATGRPDAPAPRPDARVLGDAELEYVRLDATSPHLHRGAFLDPETESTLAEEVKTRGKGAVFAYCEPRLTRTERAGPSTPVNVPLSTEVSMPSGGKIHAPFSGTLSHTKEGVSLTGDFGQISITGITSCGEGNITAGDAIGATLDTRMKIKWLRPGVTSAPDFIAAASLPAWRRLTRDPAPLLGLPSANWLPDVNQTRAHRDAAVPSAAERYYEQPPAIERGWREILYDTTGRGYIDMVNNVAGIGHGHPRMADAVAEQLLTLNTNSRFLYSSLARYVERLRELAPHPSLSAVMLVNSGSEAVELALKLAHAHTGRRDVVALREAYHGWTGWSDAVSTSAFDNPSALGSRPAHVHIADAVNTYRGKYTEAEPYVADFEALLTRLDEKGTPVGAFIAEPVFGNGGGVTYPPGYLPAAYAAVRKRGGVCIADEVQVGLGRLGHYTWGVQQQGVVPDIIAVAKALGNSYPLGAVLAREGMFFSSAGGATASAVAGLAVLDIMRDEDLQSNAADVGDHLNQRLKGLMEKHQMVGCVHGLGLYQGVELVRDRKSKEPAKEETAWVCERLLDFGVVMQPTSERQNVLKIKPPLTLTREHADVFVDALDAVLGELSTRLKD